MYSLRLTCKPEEIELLSAELYDAGTAGIREIDEDSTTVLIAGFGTNEQRNDLLGRFQQYSPEWAAEAAVDWVRVSQDAWPAREIGQRLFLAPPWSDSPTPEGHIRVVHNPALACGTGEHPCTQLALIALEQLVTCGCTVVDVGTGSGILAISGRQLGASTAIGLDIDCAALNAARENFELNDLPADVICGSADCVRASCADVTVANISATVLLSIWEDLRRITRPGGSLVVTGFPESEAPVLRDLLEGAEQLQGDDWICFVATVS
jgi:ribosomal protein L11 methyltransferase